TTSKVLTMDFVKGTKITSISPLAKLEFDSTVLIEELFKAYLDQVLIDGFFHADPHPGNVFLTDDKRIALIDLGMTARVDPNMQENLLKLMLYISEGRGYEAAELSIDMSIKSDLSNREIFIREVSSFVSIAQDAKIEQIEMGKIIVQLTRIASNNGFRTSPELTMLGKTLLHLDEIGRVLDPNFNPNEAIRKHTESIVRKHLLKNFSPGHFFSGLIETKELIQKLPIKLSRIIDNIADNNITIKTQAFDESILTENFQKVANRITLGLVLGALIVGAAMLMRVETQFTVFGYPGFAMIMFLIAAVCGFGLVFSILLNDKRAKKKKT
ncbi:MAG: AarF/UbiB family protein, partial [Ignavibacteriaceae bacterium]